MDESLLVGLALIPALGIVGQWVAWRLKAPSIIFLLLIGLFVGPLSDSLFGEPILDIEHLLGELLFPVVSASVAIVLFEGGLSLRFSDIRGSLRVVRNLVTIGVGVTWLISAAAAYVLFDLSVGLSLLLGATIVVTGPTVIIPLINQIRPKGRVGFILRWEGIIIDPVGAVLAVLVFEEVIGGPNVSALIGALVVTLTIGGVLGWGAARGMVAVYRRFWVPDSLQNPVTVAVVLAAFAVSNVIQPESGLVTVTVMGIVMTNQKQYDIRHIIEFKETLQVLLLSSLFIMLAARLQPSELQQIGWNTVAFVLIIILVERPLAVYLSTLGEGLNWRERLFIAWMAPRGIVAASVASIFALELQERGFEEAAVIVPQTFAVIITTVAVYSLTAGPLARRLGLADRDPQGLLIVGTTPWIRDMATAVQDNGFRVLMAETNRARANISRRRGLEVYYGNVLSDSADEEMNLGGIGRMLAMTPNAEVNALCGERFQNRFGSNDVYELQHGETISQHLGGRSLFPEPATYDDLAQRFQDGARVMTVEVEDPNALQHAVPGAVLPLFVIPDASRLGIWTTFDPPRMTSGQRVIIMVKPDYVANLVELGAIKSLEGEASPETVTA